jgi:hypothetical protein
MSTIPQHRDAIAARFGMSMFSGRVYTSRSVSPLADSVVVGWPEGFNPRDVFGGVTTLSFPVTIYLTQNPGNETVITELVTIGSPESIIDAIEATNVYTVTNVELDEGSLPSGPATVPVLTAVLTVQVFQ